MAIDEKFKNKLSVLVGKKLQCITRTCELVCFCFGELSTNKKYDEKETSVSEYVLHNQCPFRITYKNRILLGSSDLFISSQSDIQTVDLNKQNVCYFDNKSQDILSKFDNEYVTEIFLGVYNDLEVKTTNLIITFFVCDTEYESWRFFKKNSNECHILVDERGISYDG